MGLNYKNIGKGKYVYSEITGNNDDDSSVKSSIGDNWYLHVIADMVNQKVVSEQEFANFFEAHVEGLD
jgi:hypothetical protein